MTIRRIGAGRLASARGTTGATGSAQVNRQANRVEV
jgi:hypothetical protein